MNQQFVLSIGFPQYTKDKTGMSKVILTHQKMYNDNHVSFVHLFAVKKMILHDKFTLFSYFGMLIDGKFDGVYTPEQVIQKCQNWYDEGHELLDIHLHHFLYMVPSKVDTILKVFSETPINVYLHDYYLACTEYTLLKNKESYCGGQGLSPQNCKGCQAYEKSIEVEGRIHQILRNYSERICFISPSETTKKIFERFHPEYKGHVLVVPHQRYTLGRQENKEPMSNQDIVKVAFTAMPRRHKGWETWKKLAERFNGKGYEFIIFNSSSDTHENMRKREIHFSQDNLNAMTDALLDEKIHLSVLWAICPETYSYTCFESYSANAFIVTNSVSGNIADVVRQESNGVILDNEEELFALFENRQNLIEMINAYRCSAIGGPVQLFDNDDIVRRSLEFKPTITADGARSEKTIHKSLIPRILEKIIDK